MQTNPFLHTKLGTKGYHSNIRPVEEPKSETQETEEPTTKVQVEEPTKTFTPPPPDLIETLQIVEHPNLANQPAVKNIIICKNCKQEQSTVDINKPCLYHRGVQVYVFNRLLPILCC